MASYIESLFSLEGHVAVVTGGTRGIGKSMALALAGAGADSILIQRDEKNLDTKTEVEKLGRKAHTYTADLTEQADVENISKRILSDGHDVDIAVFCAGIQRRHTAQDFPMADWDEVLQVNLRSVWTLCRDFGSYMLSCQPDSAGRRGCIINIASLLSFQGGINVPAYAAAKGGVAQLTKALSNKWSSQGISVNAIAPGYIDTEMNSALMADNHRATSILERIAVDRWGRPQDFQGPVVFLASAASSYVSGEILLVDGGWMGR